MLYLPQPLTMATLKHLNSRMLNRHQVKAPVFPVLGFANPMFREIGIDNLSWLPPKGDEFDAFNLAHLALFRLS